MTNKTPSAIDLVERLTEAAYRNPAHSLYTEAAGTITRLQAALERLVEACEPRRVTNFDPSSRVTVIETRTKDILDFHEALDGADEALRSSVGGE